MDFMKYKWWWFGISALLVIPGIIGLLTYGLKLGIDLRGGTFTEIHFTDGSKGNPETVKEALNELELGHLTVQSSGEGSVIIRTESISEETRNQMFLSLKEKVGESTLERAESIGPTISSDLTRKAILAVIVASLVIIFYIAYAFRGVPHPASSWRFGVSAVVALVHDLVFVIGTFAILGHFFDYEVDSLFITALLTVMGFSVHDTIVVFDRIRENLKRFPSQTMSQIANISLAQTLGRSLATSLTVIFVLLTLFLLGAESTKPFILALLLGVTIGTYSSIFNATPLMVMWHERATRPTRA